MRSEEQDKILDVTDLKCLTFNQKMENYIKDEIDKFEEKVKNGEIVEEEGIIIPKKRGRKPSTNHIKIKKFIDQIGPPPTQDEEELLLSKNKFLCLDNKFEVNEKNKRRRKEINLAKNFDYKNDEVEPTPLDKNEVLIQVSVSHIRKLSKQIEFIILGSQYLTVLKDHIYCLHDVNEERCHRKSGYFFIENVFYNDMRNVNNIDYSRKIIDWSEENTESSTKRIVQNGINVFKSRKMENTRFLDLKMVIGKPYLYVHQGDCEHLLTFVKVWRISDDDKPTLDFYPQKVFAPVYRKKKCKVCDVFPSEWVAVDDPLFGDAVSYACTKCYENLHSGSNNIAFKKYKYSHEE
eukprot:TRINITY_DN6141_c0_g1_i1.p1 TRINITY_DN6141_c0_g1~~TRINITY_DN6141_c0_g1_i1.p1  ORF type:complete len:386 (-),score=109.24 TRINITY_DN6141_c0_g1_i1:91-1137(-)